MIGRISVFCLVAISLVAFPGRARAQDDDVADVPSVKRQVGRDENARYFLIGSREDANPPKGGYGLIVVLPGGGGGADFHPFVKRIYKHAIPEGYLVAQPIAVKWTEGQTVVWPTEKSPAEKMKFSTELFVARVINDVMDAHKIDRKRIFTLSWSSGGPAAYKVSITIGGVVVGSFIAMSAFKPEYLPRAPATNLRGHAYYLFHSPEDKVCPFAMAEQAVEELKRRGGKVTLVTYEGGHGWKAGLYDEIRKGIAWLEKNGRVARR